MTSTTAESLACRTSLRQVAMLTALATISLLVRVDRVNAASVVAPHKGSTDPAAEGFGQFACCGGPWTGVPLKNDLGKHAWSVATVRTSDQYVYNKPLFPAQVTQTANGFSLTTIMRAVQGVAPSYTPAAPTVVAGVGFDDGSAYWIIDLGLDANGDTVVVLPTSITQATPGGVEYDTGPSYTLVGSGSRYNTYKLTVKNTKLGKFGKLYVNGSLVLSSYAGDTSYVPEDQGFNFGVVSGGQGNFNLINLTVP